MKSKNYIKKQQQILSNERREHHANTKISADQVEELLLKGKSHGGVLTYREIMDSMQNVEDMTPDDMDSMYELIAQKAST